MSELSIPETSGPKIQISGALDRKNIIRRETLFGGKNYQIGYSQHHSQELQPLRKDLLMPLKLRQSRVTKMQAQEEKMFILLDQNFRDGRLMKPRNYFKHQQLVEMKQYSEENIYCHDKTIKLI